MSFSQGRPAPFVLAPKPSTSFSTTSSSASATSAGTSRSGGSKLLFGEIDTSSDRSSETFASVCSLVLSDSSTFLRFWLTDRCRENLLSHLPKPTLAKLRLVCHDFSERAAPSLFQDLGITFKPSTFTRPARLAALDRIGYHVKTLSFNLPHTPETFLPPLVHPETGEELSFTYTPQVQPPGFRQAKYGDDDTTDVLTRQYPPLFHAATNGSAFVNGFAAFVNLEHLKISCPGYDASQRYRRSAVDFALISLRIAVERNCLSALDTLTLAPMHPNGLLYLSPLLGSGATPNSAKRWSKMKHLTVHTTTTTHTESSSRRQDDCRLLQAYLSNFQSNLETFDFSWIGERGPLPLVQEGNHDLSPNAHHPAKTSSANTNTRKHHDVAHSTLCFRHIKRIRLTNVAGKASYISSLVRTNKPTLSELDLDDFRLTHGTWEEAFAPLNPPQPPKTPKTPKTPEALTESANIPIMLSPSTAGSPSPSPPRKMERVERMDVEVGLGRKKDGKRRAPGGVRKVREGCEELFGKMLRASVGFWR